jgi:hypothetical protein
MIDEQQIGALRDGSQHTIGVARAFVAAGLAVGFGLTASAVAGALTTIIMRQAPVGADVRPMGLALLLLLITGVSLAVGIGLRAYAFIQCPRRGRTRWWLGTILLVVSIAPNLLPDPASQRVLWHVVLERHLHIVP